MRKYMRIAVGVAFAAMLFFGATVKLETVPPVWWDEGWTLSAARTWIEKKHYGRLLAGQLAPAGLEASPFVTMSVALSFHILGTGVVQGRLIAVAFTIATLAVLCYLVRRLYNPSIAFATVAVLLCMPAYIQLHPIYLGRQVLGEMPALFTLIIGYSCFLAAARPRLLWLMLTIVSWAIALTIKLQVIPFWICSMLIPMLCSAYERKWKSMGLFGVALVGSLLGAKVVISVWQLILQDNTITAEPITGLYYVTALVGSSKSRLSALLNILVAGIPTLVGLCYGLWSVLRRNQVCGNHTELVRFSLLILAGSWFSWYAAFSNGVTRYLFPATFIGSIFVAVMFYELMSGCNGSFAMRQFVAVLRGCNFNKQNMGVLLVIALMVTSVPRTALGLYQAYFLEADKSVQQVARFINTETPPGALIETYDSELHLFLERAYHYPPDRVHVELIRRSLFNDVSINYDSLIADPDYLVIGPMSKGWRLYNPVLNAGAFQLARSFGRYEVYQRVR
jgi:hypothetical protein